jgi:outer membrane protein TolC
MESLEAQAMQWEQTVTFQVHQSYTDLQLSAEQIKLWQQAVDQATEATRLAEQQYFEGEVDLLIFVQARRDLVSVTSEYLGTLKNYQVNLATLEWAVGKDLTGGENK